MRPAGNEAGSPFITALALELRRRRRPARVSAPADETTVRRCDVLANAIGGSGGRTRAASAARPGETRRFEVPLEIGDNPADFRAALIRYWSLLMTVDTASRYRALETLRSHARWSSERNARALALFVLGDVDATIVYEATCGYLRGARGTAIQRRFADVLEWLARRLALRNDVVFAALLAHGNAAVDEQLLAQRHATTSSGIRQLLASLRVDPDDRADAFLREWRALETTATTG
jgi:hypothetical protein